MHSVQPARRRRLLWAAGIFIIGLVVVLGGVEIVLDHRKTVESAYERLENLARIAEEAVSGNMRTIDVMLQDVAHAAAETHSIPGDEALLAYMKARVASINEVRNISVFDAGGRIVLTTLPQLMGIDGSKRAFFTRPVAAQNKHQLFVEGPIKATTGATVILASRLIPLAPEVWRGLVLASLPPSYFASILESVRPQDDGFATLLGSDGVVMAHAPTTMPPPGGSAVTDVTGAPPTSNQPVRVHDFVAADGVPTLLVLRATDAPGLTVAVGWSEARVLAEWRSRSLLKGVILGLLGFIAVLVLRRFAQHEGELTAKTRFIQAITDSVPSMVGYWDAELRCRFANRHYREWLARSPEQIIGHTMLELMGERLYTSNRQPAAEALKGQRQIFERSITMPDGETAHTQVYYVPDVAPTGEVLGFYVLAHDITSLKRTENQLRTASERLRLAARAGRIGVWEHDLTTGVLEWDDRMFLLYGVSPGATAPSYPLWRSLCRPADLARVEEEMAATLDSGADFDTEFQIHRPDGATRNIKAAAVVDRDDDGQARRVIGVNWDITAIRENEKALAAAQAAAEQANRAKSDFLANMSHEIRTPMNAILGLAHLLERSQLSGDQRDLAFKIKAAGQGLLAIINDILDFSKVEAGRMDLEVSEFRLAALLDAISTIMAVNASAKDLELVIDAAPGTPSRLIGDPLRLQQVLINLTSNAIKFTETGEVTLRVEPVGGSVGDGGEVDTVVLSFTVQDSGIGIEPQAIPTLFDAFTQADSSTTRRFGGSGLGLSISKRLVRLMGGEIGVRSVPGEGSTFWFTVPFTVPAEVARDHDDAGRLEVLIADDHDVAREAIAATAQSLGWTAEAVGSGQEALDRVHERSSAEAAFDVLILDWRMPEIDGLQVGRRVRGIAVAAASPIVIMVTAHNREDLARAPGAELVDAVLVKPVTASSLYNAVMDARARRSGGAAALAAAVTADVPVGGLGLAGVRLLVVEDNSINQEVARRVLELEGASVTLASDGQEALDLLAADPAAFDAVLMDVQMPRMDGYEATRRLRRDLGLTDLPVLALTAGALAAERERARLAGMNDFIAKPFDLHQMIQAIRRHTGRTGHGAAADGAVVAAARPPAAPSSFDLAGIDVAKALRNLGGNRTLLASLLGLFEQQFAEAVVELRAELAAGRVDEAAQRLHSLRGAAGNLTAAEVAGIAGQAETAMRTGRPDRLPALLDALDDALATLIAAIRDHRAAAPAAANGHATLDADEAEALLLALDARSMAALDAFARLRPALDSLSPAIAEEIGQDIDHLRFDDAARRLRALLAAN